MIFRICEFLISSVNTSPAGTKTFAGAGAAGAFAAVSTGAGSLRWVGDTAGAG
jgi:hypothetical protein